MPELPRRVVSSKERISCRQCLKRLVAKDYPNVNQPAVLRRSATNTRKGRATQKTNDEYLDSIEFVTLKADPNSFSKRSLKQYKYTHNMIRNSHAA